MRARCRPPVPIAQGKPSRRRRRQRTTSSRILFVPPSSRTYSFHIWHTWMCIFFLVYANAIRRKRYKRHFLFIIDFKIRCFIRYHLRKKQPSSLRWWSILYHLLFRLNWTLEIEASHPLLWLLIFYLNIWWICYFGFFDQRMNISTCFYCN